jgi:spore protease
VQLKTDLILEVANLNKKANGYKLITSENKEGLVKTRIEVLNKEGSKILGKNIGHYITLDASEFFLFEEEDKRLVAQNLAHSILELKEILKIKNLKKVLVVGLGNKQIMSDSLGPKVCDKIIITRHIKEVINKEDTTDLNSISAISTGVLGTTGIETASIVKAVVNEVKPDLVIVVDTLSTLSTKRLATNFQMSTGGIVPGGGVGNHRKAIDEASLGVPIIAIGVPLVVYAYSMCKEVMEKVTGELKHLEQYEDELNKIASSVLGDLIVTIKDIDKVVENLASLIGAGINLAVNPKLGLDKILDFMN